jgi:hypothetical protein
VMSECSYVMICNKREGVVTPYGVRHAVTE